MHRFINLLALLLLPCCLPAQLHWQAAAGWISSSITDSSDDPDYISGLDAELAVVFPLTGKMGLRTALGYSQKGYHLQKVSDNALVGPIDITTDMRLHYLRFWPSVTYAVWNKAPFSAALLSGPTLSYGLSGSQDIELIIKDTPDAYTEDVIFGKNQLQRWDVGLQAGVQLQFEVSPSFHVYLSPTFEWGFLELSNFPGQEDADNFHRSFRLQLSVGYHQ